MRTLASKLTLAFLLVGVLVVVLVGGFVSLRTRNAYDRLVFDQNITAFSTMLENYYQAHGSWAGVDSVFERSRFDNSRFNRRRVSVALLDADRDFLGGIGEFVSSRRPSVQERLRATPLTVDGATVGWLAIDAGSFPAPDRQALPLEVFLSRITQAIIYGALGAVLLALVLGVVLARTISQPVHALTEATQVVARGQFGQPVPVTSNDEIGQLTASFNRMSADLARTSEARKQMTADIAHELRTPLSVVMVYAEGLKDGKLAGTPQTYTALHDTARHLQHLVDDLRILALADAGELTLNRRPVDPRALLERTALAHMVPARDAGIELLIEAPEELPAVDADPERISQVLTNLVANALRHTPAGGRVVLAAREAGQGHELALQVRDTGGGIAAADLPFVFDRFYRGDKARQAQHGESGLGLAIARSIVESHGGKIEVASTPGRGATFTVTLPAVSEG